MRALYEPIHEETYRTKTMKNHKDAKDTKRSDELSNLIIGGGIESC